MRENGFELGNNLTEAFFERLSEIGERRLIGDFKGKFAENETIGDCHKQSQQLKIRSLAFFINQSSLAQLRMFQKKRRQRRKHLKNNFLLTRSHIKIRPEHRNQLHKQFTLFTRGRLRWRKRRLNRAKRTRPTLKNPKEKLDNSLHNFRVLDKHGNSLRRFEQIFHGRVTEIMRGGRIQPREDQIEQMTEKLFYICRVKRFEGREEFVLAEAHVLELRTQEQVETKTVFDETSLVGWKLGKRGFTVDGAKFADFENSQVD